MINIDSWVRPNGNPADSNEIIVGRVVHQPPGEYDEVQVAWLSNERGLWLNYESLGDLAEIPVPEIGLIECLMVSAVPVVPAGYEV